MTPPPTDASSGTTARRAPVNSVSTRIILCVFFSTLVTAVIVSWMSVGAIHEDVRGRVTDRSQRLLAETGEAIEAWQSEGSSHLVLSVAMGGEWHDALLRALDTESTAGDLHWTAPAATAELVSGAFANLPAPPPELAGFFDRLSLHRGLRTKHEPRDCLTSHVDVLRSTSEVAGHLDGCLSESALYEIIQSPRSELRGLRTLILDATGEVTAAAGIRSAARRGERLPMADLLYSADNQLAEYKDDSGDRLVGIGAPLGETSWSLVVEAEYAQAFAPAISITSEIFVVNICMLFFFSVLAYKMATAIMKPIEALSMGAQRIAEGHVNYQIPAPPNDDDELGLLTRAFNSMMNKLRTSQLEVEQERFRLAEQNEELQHANEILAQLSITDGLTKLHNHRYFQDHLTREIKRVGRTGAPLAMILLDIDDFKQLNDTYGHAAGDEVLVSLAAIMNDSARESDLIARYGGEEFVILMPNTDMAGAVHLAEKIRMSVETTRLIIGDSLRPVEITISLGVALFSGNRREFFAEADKALYKAKAAGKNCVIIAGPDVERIGSP